MVHIVPTQLCSIRDPCCPLLEETGHFKSRVCCVAFDNTFFIVLIVIL